MSYGGGGMSGAVPVASRITLSRFPPPVPVTGPPEIAPDADKVTAASVATSDPVAVGTPGPQDPLFRAPVFQLPTLHA